MSADRFEFGKNWGSFLSVLNEDRIREAEKHLQEMLGATDLAGRRFLDVGSGSGLFSLAARRLGASVHSFDFDPDSVACTSTLRQRYFPDDRDWRVERGSILDEAYVASLGAFDVVYSYGVLHHTGEMMRALEIIGGPVKPGGKLYIAIYNDQGWQSRVWWLIKKTYNANFLGRAAVCFVFFPIFTLKEIVKSALTRTNTFRYRNSRGMSMVHDWIDWLGGYPFEVASVETLSGFYEAKGFSTEKVKRTRSWGNNELVFGRGR
jgi:2-polyprenyl-3-methyl-5-hydroxy-6-metoxy-1,4-benzoquinol methylase